MRIPLEHQPYSSVEEVRDYIERQFGIVYQSKPSYSDLLKATGLSWHRTQAATPKRDDGHVLQKREAIKKLGARRAEIASGEVLVFAEDECHYSQEVQDYLSQVNQGLEEQDWKVTCLLFAPQASDQSPVEDVWQQGKTFCEGIFMKIKRLVRLNGGF